MVLNYIKLTMCYTIEIYYFMHNVICYINNTYNKMWFQEKIQFYNNFFYILTKYCNQQIDFYDIIIILFSLFECRKTTVNDKNSYYYYCHLIKLVVYIAF